MQMTELIAAARFVVDSEGHKKAVMLDYGHWQELLTLLEDLSDLQEIGPRSKRMPKKRSHGNRPSGVESARRRCIDYPSRAERRETFPDFLVNYSRLASQHIEGLSLNPRPRDAKALGGRTDRSLRVGVYRILYFIDDEARTVTIARVVHRRESYR